jgi:hypothetical protein
MVTGEGVEADTDGSEPMVKKAVTHSAIAREMVLLCRILISFVDIDCFGLLWLLVVRSHFWRFTEVLQEIRRDITRKVASPR